MVTKSFILEPWQGSENTCDRKYLSDSSDCQSDLVGKEAFHLCKMVNILGYQIMK